MVIKLLTLSNKGFAEAYMDQEVECDNLVGLFIVSDHLLSVRSCNRGF